MENLDGDKDPITAARDRATVRIQEAVGFDGPVGGTTEKKNDVPERMDALAEEIREARENA